MRKTILILLSILLLLVSFSSCSEDPRVAPTRVFIVSVDENGNVRSLKTGSAIISATITDEYGNTYTSECMVKANYSLLQLFIIIFLLGFLWY